MGGIADSSSKLRGGGLSEHEKARCHEFDLGRIGRSARRIEKYLSSGGLELKVGRNPNRALETQSAQASEKSTKSASDKLAQQSSSSRLCDRGYRPGKMPSTNVTAIYGTNLNISEEFFGLLRTHSVLS